MANPRQPHHGEDPITECVIKVISETQCRRSKMKRVTISHEKKKQNREEKAIAEFASRSTKKRKEHKKFKRKQKSKLLFSKFLRIFFNIPEEQLFDPFYFAVIPNMLALMSWCFLLSLFVMISLTILFCLCDKHQITTFRTFITHFSFFLPLVCVRQSYIHCFDSQKLRKHTFILALSNSIMTTFFTMLFQYTLPSGSHVHIIILCVLALIMPVYVRFVNDAFVNKYADVKDDKLSKKFVGFLVMGLAQVLLIGFWTWFPPKIMQVSGNYLGSFLVTLLLNFSKHAQMLAFYFRGSRFQPDTVHVTMLLCLYYVGFEEFLVFSFASQDQYFFLLFMHCFVDLCEILYHAKALSDQRDPILSLIGYEYTPKTFDIVTNQRSSYICVMEIVEIIVALYFTSALFVFAAFGLHGLDGEAVDTSSSSFAWSLIGFIVWEIFTGLLLRWILSRKNVSLISLHDQIYLMENEFEMMFIMPLVLVGYFLITWQTLLQSVTG